MRFCTGHLVSIIVVLFLFSGTSHASHWELNGVRLCRDTADEGFQQVVSDGAGGAIVAWADGRSPVPNNIYAQRIDRYGCPQWSPGGVLVCQADGQQYFPLMVSDGSGGAIIAWSDTRNGNIDIYAQRIDSRGRVYWDESGVPIGMGSGSQVLYSIASDGFQGAVVCWEDQHASPYRVLAQRVDGRGDLPWDEKGIAVCPAPAGGQSEPSIAASGSNFIVAWSDERDPYNIGIYAQQIDSDGKILWSDSGHALCSIAGNRYLPALASDGANGAIVTWMDHRAPDWTWDIYAQRVSSIGEQLWSPNGVPVCTTADDQTIPLIVRDEAGGAIIMWRDYRGAWSSILFDLYAQRISSLGEKYWATSGAPIYVASAGDSTYSEPKLISDGAGGAIAAWAILHPGNVQSVSAQRINEEGTVLWTAHGRSICSVDSHIYLPTLASDSAEGAIVAWPDDRESPGFFHIYAQRVEKNGYWGWPSAYITSIADVPGDQGGSVNVTFEASRLDALSLPVEHYSIFRRYGGPWQWIADVPATHLASYTYAAATLADSMAGDRHYNGFYIEAHMTAPVTYWTSPQDSGYSVDNLAPAEPQNLAGEQRYSPPGLDLSWSRNTEIDLDHYAIYRGLSADFVPGQGNLIASPADTFQFDSVWTWDGGYFYKVSAIDIHGNEGARALLTPDVVTGDDAPRAPMATYLSQNVPNPFNPATRIVFGLKTPAAVSLRIYDVSGRLVRVLVDCARAAGQYTELWDGRDSKGSAVASGMYFYQLDAGTFTQTKKMILLR